MKQIKPFVDDRQSTWCIHCANALADVDVTRDHVPTKSLLDKPYPENVPVIPVCRKCNESFSGDELYFTMFLEAVLSGSTVPETQRTNAASDRFARYDRMRERIECGRHEYRETAGETQVVWEPEMASVYTVIEKNARGHVFYEYGEPAFGEARGTGAVPLVSLSEKKRLAFLRGPTPGGLAGWPEIGSRMTERLIVGTDMDAWGWIVVQEGRYRYRVEEFDDGFRVASIIAEYLATETVIDTL